MRQRPQLAFLACFLAVDFFAVLFLAAFFAGFLAVDFLAVDFLAVSFEDPASWQEHIRPKGSPQPEGRPVNGIPRTNHFDWGPLDATDEAMGDHQVVDWAIDQLGRSRDTPLFLAVGLTKPHLPWFVPRKYFDAHPAPGVILPEVPAGDLDDIPFE